jgi:hypothetical protein
MHTVVHPVSPARRRLLELCQKVNFGRIELIPVRGGQPVLEPTPAVAKEVKFASENEPREDLKRQEFLRRRQVQDLFHQLDQLGDGVIEYLEVKHGTPFKMVVRSSPGSRI